MRKMFQKLMIGLILVISTGFDNYDTWPTLKDRTWRCETFAGSEIIFYESANGLKKAIFQIHGSGVPLAGATIFDVETDNEGAVLKDGLDLMRRNEHVLKSIRLTLTSDSELTFDSQTYHKKHDYLVAFNWQSKLGQTDTLDIEQLKSISIDKKSVYKQDCFKN